MVRHMRAWAPSNVASPPPPFPLSLGSLGGLSTRISYSVLYRKEISSTTQITPCVPLCQLRFGFSSLSLRGIFSPSQNKASFILCGEKLQVSERLQNQGIAPQSLRVRSNQSGVSSDVRHEPPATDLDSTLPLNDRRVAMRNGARHHWLHASPPDYSIWSIALLEAQSEGSSV